MRNTARVTDAFDPAARAQAAVARQGRREYGLRLTVALVLAAAAVALPVGMGAVAAGAMGAIVAGLLALGLAVAVLPYTRSPDERRHRDLEAIWRQLRPDAEREVAWDRYAAWAEARPDVVELSLIRRAPRAPKFGGAPSPYERSPVRQLDPDDMEGAAVAMEELRAQAMERELEAREGHERAALEARQLADQRKLASIDEAAAADVRAREAALQREMEESAARERASQAAALARALRRP